MRALAVLLFLTVTTVAGTAEGMAALKAGDHRTAAKEFAAAAETGDAEAQYQLAELYRTGAGVTKNERTAAKWYEAAAALDHKKAAGQLGVFLWDGVGVKQNRERALDLLKVGVAGYSVPAQFRLARLHLAGTRVGIDDADAYKYLGRAAAKGHLDAQVRYAFALKQGKVGDKEEPEKAEELFRKAVENGHPAAYRGVGECMLAKKQIVEALKWYRDAALRGDYDAQYYLANTQLERKVMAEAYAWHLIAGDPKNAWRPETDAEAARRKAAGRALKAGAKGIKKDLKAKPALLRRAEKMEKEYKKTIRANLKKGLPFEG
jgi:TPR repeat protein